MERHEVSEQLASFHHQINELRQKMHDLRNSVEPEDVENYRFQTTDGPVQLADLFGDKDTLFAIHNMGAACLYCTLWADGFNGIVAHLQDRAAFVVTSPDDPASQEKFKTGRGWRFPMVSHQGTSFAEDMGYKGEHGWTPGVSVFKKSGKAITRVSTSPMGPGDDFCSLWHLFDLIPEGADGWQPKYEY